MYNELVVQTSNLYIFSPLPVFTFVTDIKWMMAVAGVWGFGVGVNISLFTLVMARIVGVENLAALLGASSLLVAFGFITLGPLIGMVILVCK